MDTNFCNICAFLRHLATKTQRISFSGHVLQWLRWPQCLYKALAKLRNIPGRSSGKDLKRVFLARFGPTRLIKCTAKTKLWFRWTVIFKIKVGQNHKSNRNNFWPYIGRLPWIFWLNLTKNDQSNLVAVILGKLAHLVIFTVRAQIGHN